jgi:hypothetical protein
LLHCGIVLVTLSAAVVFDCKAERSKIQLRQ